MAIQKLPEYMINRLKAGEIVERPASVVKELVENSLDAGADSIKITINDGGRSLIGVEDNGSGIELSDMDLLLERYATSKIHGEQDLYALQSYGFRGEALASISEVAKATVLTKTNYAEIGTKLSKIEQDIIIKHVPTGFKHGTLVHIQDLFYNVPARLKFLKSSQTEYFYCYNYFQDVALRHWQKHFTLLKNDKLAFDLPVAGSLLERIVQLWKKDFETSLKELSYQDEVMTISGYVSDSSLTFGSPENIKIYVNSRPVQDKIVKKALLDAYVRQITPGEYPFAVVIIDIKPSLVDVNVHPRKLEVKFLDSQSMFQIVHETVKKTLGIHKIMTVEGGFQGGNAVSNFTGFSGGTTRSVNSFPPSFSSSSPSVSSPGLFSQLANSGSSTTEAAEQLMSSFPLQEHTHSLLGNYTLIGQIWNRYIVLSAEDSLYYIDQHALAERIAFEKMKTSAGYVKSELLLQPLMVEIPGRVDIQDKLDQINSLGFDCALLSDSKIIIYAVPQIFSIHKVDIAQLFTHIFSLEHITFDHVLDKIFASKACKTSIKAGDFLSHEQMIHLVKEGLDAIPGMFVCQHGRPFFVKVEKKTIDGFFDR